MNKVREVRRYRIAILCVGVCLSMPQIASAHAAIIKNTAWQVCEKHTKSDSCEYNDYHGNIDRGTCQLMSEKLLCVRNQPIVKADPAIDKP